MAYGSYRKTATNDIPYQSKRTRFCLTNRLCYLSDFTYKSQCSKQKLTSCIILIIPNFLTRFVQKISMTKIKLFSVTSVNFGFILNVITLIIQITDIFQNCDESWNYIECCSTIFPFNSLSCNKNFLFVVLTLTVTSHSGNIQIMIIIAH